VAEDSQHAGEEFVLPAIPLYVLTLEKEHQGLSHRYATRIQATPPEQLEPTREAIHFASAFRRHRAQRFVYRPTLMNNAARGFGHGERVFIAGV
jgi:hypothetical protein